MAWPTGKSRKEYNSQRLEDKQSFNIPCIIGHQQGGGVGNPTATVEEINNNPSPISTASNKRADFQTEGVGGCDSVVVDKFEEFRRMVKGYKGEEVACACWHCRTVEGRVVGVLKKLMGV